MKKISFLLIFLICFLALELSAGVKITMKVNDANKPLVMLIGEDKLKTSTANEANMDIIFDSKSKTMYMVDHSKKEYTKFDKEMMDKMAKTINSAMERMEKALENMPESQRESMRKMMEKQMGASLGKMEVEYNSTGKTETINGYSTEKYVMTLGGDKNSDIWIASYDELGIDKSELSVFKAMNDYFKEMLENIPMMSKKDMPDFFGIVDGFPVKSIDISGRTTELQDISNYNTSDSDFDIPNNYKEKKINMGHNE